MVEMLGPFHLGAVGSRDEHSLTSIAARVLREEIGRRCPEFSFRDCHAAGSIEFRFSLVRGDLDSYGISVQDLGNRARVNIEGNDATSLLHAVGKLLRHITFEEGIILPLLNLKLEASHQHRGHELSIYRYLDAWGPEDWERYTRELVLWGANWIWSTTSCCAPLKGCSEETATAWERHCAIQNLQAEIASSYGMGFGVHSFPNNISPDIVTPEMSWKGSYVCPSNPGARQLVLESRRMLFGRLRRIDAVFTSSHDPGGCPCQKCTPWVRTFIPLMEEEASVLRDHHPEADFYISNQALSRDENRWLFKYLRKELPDWLSGVVWGPQSRPLSELRHGLPEKYSILAFPDITHLILCQYPVVGFDHANALVHHRESPTYRPMAMRRIFRETRDLSSGSIPYSEGIHDDLNKAVWSGLHWGMEPAESVAEYARWHFGSAAQEDVQGLIFDLESSWKQPAIDNPAIPGLLKAAEAAGNKVEGGGENWRYRMLLLRCLVDAYVQVRLRRERETERQAIEVLSNRDDEIDERIDSALKMIVSTADATEASLSERILAIGRNLRDSMGLVFHPVERLDVPLSNMPWLEARLTGARSESTEEKERILSEIVGYEDPSPGGYFEDCGNVERESRRILGEDYFLEDIDPSVRLTKRRMSYGRSEWDSDVVYRFAGLCPGKHYRLSVTYLANRRMRGSQLLLANGRTLHEDMPLPEGHPATYEYGIPMELIDEGELELCFRRGKVGRGPLVSEIWLCPM